MLNIRVRPLPLFSGYNLTHPPAGTPHNVVVHVLSTEDVVKVVNISRKHGVTLVVRSGGTGLEGSQSPVRLVALLIFAICIYEEGWPRRQVNGVAFVWRYLG